MHRYLIIIYECFLFYDRGFSDAKNGCFNRFTIQMIVRYIFGFVSVVVSYGVGMYLGCICLNLNLRKIKEEEGDKKCQTTKQTEVEFAGVKFRGGKIFVIITNIEYPRRVVFTQDLSSGKTIWI